MKIPDIDPTTRHDLLYDHQSYDFKKVRRNLMVFCISIIFTSFLGIPINELFIFPTKLINSNNEGNFFFGILVLILYWGMMFECYRKRDREIQLRKIDIVETKKNYFLQNVQGSSGDHEFYKKQDLEEVGKNRSSLRQVLFVEKIELWMPRILFLFAVLIIFTNFF